MILLFFVILDDFSPFINLNSPRLLFITRTWHGTGGLQTLSRDLWREMHVHYGDSAMLCRPTRPGFLSLVSFACRACVAGWRIGRKGGRIHLGDASLCPLGAVLHRITGARVSVTATGLDSIYAPLWYQWILRTSIPSMYRVCCISRATADAVLERGGTPAKIVVIPCGIHTQHLPCRAGVSHDAPQLLSVGRLIPRKGIAWFIDKVLPLLLSDFPALTYSIIGDGPERSAVETIIRTRGLESSVHLLGAVDDRTKEDTYLASDLLIVPNIAIVGDREGFGIVCIEASARGLPVAAAKIEGISDAVQERETGRFFQSQNPEDAARVIAEMIRSPYDPAQVEQITAMHYDWVRLFPQYDAVFQ